MEYTTPPSYGSSVVNVGGLVQDGEIICAGAANSASYTELNDDPDNEWPEPAAVKFEWSGSTKDGKLVTAELAGNLGVRLDKVDVMAEVPGFVKAIIGGVAGTKPYIYQVYPLYSYLYFLRVTNFLRAVLPTTTAQASPQHWR